MLLSPLHFHCFWVTAVFIILRIYNLSTCIVRVHSLWQHSWRQLVLLEPWFTYITTWFHSPQDCSPSTVLFGVASPHLFPFIWLAPLVLRILLAVSHQAWLATMILSVRIRATEMCLKNMEFFLSGISEHRWYFIILALGTSHLSGYLIHPVDRSARESNWDGVEHTLTLILRRTRTGTVWFYTSTSNKRAAPPKLYTKSLTRDLKLMYSRLTLVRISINL